MMRIGILSDSHDNIWKLEEAIKHLATVDAVIHCGDLCAPFVVKRMAEGLDGIPIHIVWGNNDGDPLRISQVASNYSNIQLHGETAKLILNGIKIAINHYPEIALDIADSGNFDLVCYGHDHTAHQEQRGSCLLLNPGELMGMKGRSTIAIYDTVTHKVEMIDL
jgi:putative phosphoesterase